MEGPVGAMPRTTIRPSAASRAAAAAALPKAGDVGDQVVRGHHEDDRLGIAPLGEAGGQRHRRQRVAALRLERDLDSAAELGRLVGDQEPRRPRR